MFDFNQKIKDEWRELGFYYDNGDDNKKWVFFGSKIGLQNFITLLGKYLSNPGSAGLSQERAFGPYAYLKIMIWDKPTITVDYFAGTLKDLENMKNIIADKLFKSEVGQSFSIDQEYGVDNTTTATFFIMPDDFDPISMDNNYT